MRSLQARLGAGLLLSLVVVFIILWYGVSSAIRLLAEDYIASRLSHDADTLLAALRIHEGAAPAIDGERVDAIYRRPFSGHYYKISTPEGVLHSRSLWDRTLSVPLLAAGEQRVVRLDGPRQQPLLIWVAGFRKDNDTLTIAVGEDLSPVDRDIAVFQRRFAFTSVVLLFLLISVQAVIVRASLKPLARLREEVRGLERGEREYLSGDVPAEVAPLVREINHLLGVLGERLGRYRNAFGDLAHALKRPLTLLHQLRRDEALRGHPALRAAIDDQVGSMRRTIDRVLQRARLAGSGLPGARLSVSDDIPALVDALTHMYRDKEIHVAAGGPGNAMLPLDREDMLDLLGNLMENACQWARRRVRLSVRINGADVRFVVEDDGPGIAEADIAGLMRRGTRADETKEGYGLGLAIVSEIAAYYRGALVLARSRDLGGLQATVRIPLR